jgi:hypothetical protein
VSFWPGALKLTSRSIVANRAFHACKRAMWAKGLQLPTQVADGGAVCFCGAAIGTAEVESHVLAAHMEQVNC